MDDPSIIYQIVMVLHIAAAIVGFGGVIAHSAYNSKAFSATAGEAKVLLTATQTVTNLAHYGIYGVFILGLVLVAVSGGDVSFGAPWISASFLIWFLLVGVAHGLVRPTVSGLVEETEGMDPGDAMKANPKVVAYAKKLALGEGLTQLLLVAAIALMVFQPGA